MSNEKKYSDIKFFGQQIDLLVDQLDDLEQQIKNYKEAYDEAVFALREGKFASDKQGEEMLEYMKNNTRLNSQLNACLNFLETFANKLPEKSSRNKRKEIFSFIELVKKGIV